MSKPKVSTPQLSADDLARQAEADKAAAEARARAAEDKRLAEERALLDQNAVARGLRGNRSLMSTAGAVGFPTGLGGV